MIHTVIFDIGGTLVEAPNIYDELGKLFDNINFQKYSICIKSQFNLLRAGDKFFSVKKIFEKTLLYTAKEFNRLEIDISKASLIYQDVFLNRCMLINGTIELLNYLKAKNVRIFALSDADADVLIPALEKLGIFSFFNKIFVSSKLQAYKPSEKLIKEVSCNLPLPLDGIILVGDSIIDVETANKLAIKSILINKQSNAKVSPTFTISNIKYVKRIINQYI